ncbi:MAG: type I CRISPR-associated protein Cas7 [Bacteroidales bacterium]|nr:type I CRISPR-associated protein Cas7 [Bacteroidales bacterium]
MNNKEFLFIYDATLCNPNGDPDRDNEPRMDKATETNLVSDGRLKRYIRDYLIDKDKPVFVSMVGGQKVSPTTRLTALINDLEENEKKFNELVEFDKELKEKLKFYKENIKSIFTNFSYLRIFNYRDTKLESKANDANTKKEENKIINKLKEKKLKTVLNNFTLLALVRKYFIDVRLFGSAFAIDGFSQTVTGPVQINMGYSLHPVKLKSNSIVTIAGDTDGESGMGKKELLYYSLIAFTGTINSKRTEFVNLTDNDINDFREAIIKSVPYNTTDSKKNQFPKLYLEIEYNDSEIYGRLGDLRNHIVIKSNVKDKNDENDFEKLRNINELDINFSKLYEKIKIISEKIKKVRVWKAIGFDDFDEKQLNIPESSIEILTI